MKLLSLSTLLALTLVAPLRAQQPSPAQVNTLLQQPGAANMIRSRIQASGLTPDQIRARLQASGYSPAMLDAYLGDTPAGAGGDASADQLKAMEALGLAPAPVAAAPVETGAITTPATPKSGVFGVDVFRRSTTQFLPMISGPVPADYRLGPGDQLVLILTGDVELTHQVAVTREGFVIIPQVGQVFLANLTLDQARGALTDRLARVYSGVRRGGGGSTRFELSVANVRAVQVYVIGEVTQPGAYQVSALGTTLTALYTAGGVTEQANLRKVEVRRAGKPSTTFDLYEYLLKGDVSKDVRLENGDVVFVGIVERRATVAGNVNRPAAYDMAANETLADLVAAAGGLKADAAVSRISIARIVPAALRRPGEPQRVTLDVAPATGSVVPPVPLENGDIVTVYAVSDVERNSVLIAGSVFLPGKVGFAPGMTLSTLVGKAGGMLPGTYAGRAHISRLSPVDRTRRLLTVELPKDSLTPWPQDLPLEDQDQVTIYSALAMRPERTVRISGAVNEPKTVPWREGMTVRDLILEANGLRPGAWLDSAEIARLPIDRTQGQMAQTIRIPLDSTYLFDRDSAGRYIGPPGLAFRASGTAEVVLQPWDNLLVLLQPDFEYQRTVHIEGEVRFPGNYAVRDRSDRLADLIQRAGGLTERAYAEGIKFYRLTDSIGRVNIDLPEALSSPRSRHNVLLQPNDSILIPEYQPSVKVVGAVNSPGSVLWQRGKPLSYYIGAAGGLAQNAHGGQASVQQANGETETRHDGFLFFNKDPDPSPGSLVFVPTKPVEEYRDRTAMFAAIASMIASTATIVIALQQ